MRKALFILVVALVAAVGFFFPFFITRSSPISFPTDKLVVVGPYGEFQANEGVNINQEDLLAKVQKAQVVNRNTFSNSNFVLGAVISSKELILLGQTPDGSWYKTNVTVGYFQQVDSLSISSQDPKVIVYTVGGNTGNTLFWGLMSLGGGIILILLSSISDASRKDLNRATT